MDDLEVLVRLADAADELTLPVWCRGDMDITIKPDGSPVTATDVAVETAIRDVLATSHPNDGFLGEEVGGRPSRSGRRWIVDGIDGTRAFTSGRPEWSTLIALVIDEQPLMGMVTSPSLDRRWYCTPGAGSQLVVSGRPPSELTVSRHEGVAGARVVSWPATETVKPAFAPQSARLVEVFGEQPSSRPSRGSLVPNGAMLVADGRVDAFVMFGGQPWDHAATSAVVAAAGGRFSALDGSASLSTGAGVYSNGHLHEELVSLLAMS